jgi:sporulation protein YlmC with PRC-barrel domain
MAGDDRMRELEERYEGYTVYDSSGEKVGKVDDLFVDETDREEYIGVKMGLFGLSGTTLIPMELVRVNERERAIEVSETKEHVKDAPNYRDDDEVNADFEDRIRAHFGMEGAQPTGERGPYGRSAGDAAGGGAVGGGAAASGAAARAQSPQDDMRRGDRDPDDRYSGAMGGVRDRDPIGQDRIDQDRMDQERIGRDRDPADRYSDAAMGGAEDRNRAGRESYRNREQMGSDRRWVPRVLVVLPRREASRISRPAREAALPTVATSTAVASIVVIWIAAPWTEKIVSLAAPATERQPTWAA